jgi:SulP family sulfate permease
MVAGLLLLLILLALGPLASKIPAAVLAGILVTVGIGVMDFKGLRRVPQMPKAEGFVMFLVLGLTVFVGLIEAVFLGLILACILFMKTISEVVEHRMTSIPLRNFSREQPWIDEGDFIDRFGDKVYIKHLDGPLFFGFASRFQEMLKALPSIEVVVIRMDKVPYIDQSGLLALEEAIQDLQSEEIRVLFTDVHGQPLDMLERTNLIPGLVSEEHCFDSFDACSRWMRSTWLKSYDADRSQGRTEATA